ncbi:MAG: DUF4175 domain-containing protein, partial [Bacteroidia bacterium]|nr:DUF4175 domain-containing protein [Bacteroidia bacterium]
MEKTESNSIIYKLDEFIRKFYKNQLIKGTLYAVGLGLAFYLGAAMLEYFANFGTSVRTFLFYAWMLSSAFVITKYIALPLSKLYRLGKIISHEQAAAIIGLHFANVQDKLINYLQLSASKADIVSSDLWQASIDQKIKELKPVPFTSAIDLTENKKHLRFVFIPIAVLIFILFAAPSILTESTKRLVNYNSEYNPPAP